MHLHIKGVDIVYARSNLRAQGDGEILWHNMRSFRGLCPVGTEVKITGYTDKVICFVKPKPRKDMWYMLLILINGISFL